ncbi:MAG: protease inhibitor I42 family protein [Firmicutes bacterium]|nr:protease inhibitor I42 family protein [Bacillota bacterium]
MLKEQKNYLVKKGNDMNRNRYRILPLLLVMLVLTAFTAAWSETATATTPVDVSKLSNAVKWVYMSDDYKICCAQAYQSASQRLPQLVKDKKPGTWCVVVDMDETIVSNVEAQAILETSGEKYSRANWIKWCEMEKCTPLEGALEFNGKVKQLGGLYLVVTNRGVEEQKATIENLDKIGFKYDAAVFKAGPYATDETKQWRRDDIEAGTLKGLPGGKSLPPLNIVMLAGDQLSDIYDPVCYGLDDVKGEVAEKAVFLPNPMYGYWEQDYKGFTNKKVKVGEEFCIWLKSNVTTGYSWSLDPSVKSDVVKKVSNVYKAPKTEMCGAGGVEVWKFKAVAKGKVKLILNYSRPFDKGVKPAQVKTFNITVE